MAGKRALDDASSGSPTKKKKQTTLSFGQKTSNTKHKDDDKPKPVKDETKAKAKPKAKKPAGATTAAPSTTTNLNKDITDILMELGKNEAAMGQKFKAQAYRRASAALSKHDKRVTSGKEAKELPGVGAKIAKKIDEILATGQLDRLERDKANPRIAALRLFERVSGIGPKAAAKFVDAGCETLDDVRKQPGLSHHIQLGLKYFDDWELKIPRNEMTELETKIRDIIANDKDSGIHDLSLTICGSYRRGAAQSGDIDILVTTKEAGTDKKQLSGILARVIAALKRCKGFLADDLTSDHSVTKYMGTCRLTPEHHARRIDVRVLPYESYYPGVLYFTGSDLFNTKMRQIAIEKGYHLSEYALSVSGVHSKVAVPVSSEKEIFDVLGMDYVEPADRNIDK